MRTIYKYKVEPGGDVEMPHHAKILSCGVQGDDIYVWAEVDTKVIKQMNAREFREVRAYPTGAPIEKDIKYNLIGMVQMESVIGQLVFHIVEVING